jgi:RNA polymerase sigma factor for flagellar operon FliA
MMTTNLTTATPPITMQGFPALEAARENVDWTAPAEPGGVRTNLHSAPGGSEQKAENTDRDQLLLEHLPLVKAIACSLSQRLPAYVEMDDLIQAGILGLFAAAERYDAKKAVPFQLYAKHRIRGAILDSLRALDSTSRDMRRHQKRADAAAQELAGVLGRSPTEGEISEKLGMSLDRWRKLNLNVVRFESLSTFSRSNDFEGPRTRDFPCSVDSYPDAALIREELQAKLAEAVKTLPERYQFVVSMYFEEGMTMKEIGKTMGINESRVSQIRTRALKKIAAVLQQFGITSSHAFEC